jgi:mono/diheme cytochrome c family protein
MNRIILILLAALGPLPAAEPGTVSWFEREVRPLLAARCVECHGADKAKGGLRLHRGDALAAGGDSGEAVVPGDADASLLVRAVRRTDPDLAMPPDEALAPSEVAVLERWVELGAPWGTDPEPDAGAVAVDADGFTAEDRNWWAVRPVADPAVPEHGDGWARNEIDRFVRAGLERAGLEPAPEASRIEWIRRLSYDLHGLPPTPEQVDAFVKDSRPDAWERLVEDFLVSPRYGERWAQHWLDVVRWAESDGYRQDAFRPQAWPYREYVVRSLNQDKPYDVFVREQLAGDQVDPDNPDVLVATGFLRNGPYEYNQRDARSHWDLIVNELTGVTAEAFLGLGLGCAQCHDHKFDPLLQRDYFALQAFLAPVSWRHDLPLAAAEQRREHASKQAAWEAATAEVRREIDAILEPRILRAQRAAIERFPEDIQAMFAKAREERTPLEQQLVELADIQVRYERERFDEKSVKDEAGAKLAELKKRLAAFDSLKPKPLPAAFVATDVGPEAPEVVMVTRRGKVPVEPGFPAILGLPAPEIPRERPEGSTGRRLALANWIGDGRNPLSARVLANRIWQHHFGTGLVATPNDFGTLGEPPSHPELLDWLASRLVEDGWSWKALHRRILLSATYRQTALREPGARERETDPGNRLLWRFPPRRLDAEQIRDAMLLASGELVPGPVAGSVDGNVPRRSLYVKKLRNTPDPVLAGFDLPLGFGSSPTRPETTTALQALLLANGEWTWQRARTFATRVLGGQADPASVGKAFRIAFGREPAAEEVGDALAFVEAQRRHVGSGAAREERFPGETGVRPVEQAFGKASGQDLGLGTHALWLQPGSRFERLEASGEAPGEAFTVEAVVTLDHPHADASVATLVSRWNGNPLSPGWTLGVTGAKSRYTPGSVIVQLVGEDDQANTVYEVVPSGLVFPLGKPVYVAATIRTPRPGAPGATQTGSVTFRVRDLSDPEAETRTVRVEHAVVAPPHADGTRFLVGGRDQAGHLWDGQVARLALRRGEGAPEAGPFQGSGPGLDWTFGAGPEAAGGAPLPGTRWFSSGGTPPPEEADAAEALADFCHALFNSSEFLYLH